MNGESIADSAFLQKTYDTVPVPVMVVDDDVRVILPNNAAKAMFAMEGVDTSEKRAGELLSCVNSLEKGCGQSAFCKDCVIRKSVNHAISGGGKVFRVRTRVKLLRDGKQRNVNLLVTAVPFNDKGRDLSLVMLEDINELIQIGSILPICAGCKKIRNEKGEWEDLEKYIREHVDVDFSHAFCPDCVKRLYPEIWEELKKEEKA